MDQIIISLRGCDKVSVHKRACHFMNLAILKAAEGLIEISNFEFRPFKEWKQHVSLKYSDSR